MSDGCNFAVCGSGSQQSSRSHPATLCASFWILELHLCGVDIQMGGFVEQTGHVDLESLSATNDTAAAAGAKVASFATPSGLAEGIPWASKTRIRQRQCYAVLDLFEGIVGCFKTKRQIYEYVNRHYDQFHDGRLCTAAETEVEDRWVLGVVDLDGT